MLLLFFPIFLTLGYKCDFHLNLLIKFFLYTFYFKKLLDIIYIVDTMFQVLDLQR